MDQQQDDDALTQVERQLCENIRELMKSRRMNQAELALKLNRTQPWVSKRMSRNPEQGNKWKVEDLQDLQRVFQLSAYELLRPGHGRLDRRTPQARRKLNDRRADQGGHFVSDASSRLASAIASSESVIETANYIYELAERLHAFARLLLTRHTADIGDTPADGALPAETLGRTTRGAGSQKAG